MANKLGAKLRGYKAEVKRLKHPVFSKAVVSTGKIIVVSGIIAGIVSLFDLGITEIVSLFF